jgi:hypothetical protein
MSVARRHMGKSKNNRRIEATVVGWREQSKLSAAGGVGFYLLHRFAQ